MVRPQQVGDDTPDDVVAAIVAMAVEQGYGDTVSDPAVLARIARSVRAHPSNRRAS